MVVGVARIVLALGQARSLKDKRAVVRKLVDRVRARFPVAIGETEDHDVWQRATLGVAVIGSEPAHVRTVVDAVLREIEDAYVAPVVAQDVHVGRFEDFEAGALAADPGAGPNAFTREVLAGEPEPEDEDDAIEDAPWARK